MRSIIVTLLLAATLATANIIFNKVQPTCDHSLLQYDGCLKGQLCLVNDT